jgi:hypothetical protein
MSFAAYVEGKSVAVVGPAVAPYDQREEVEAHDIVARISYRHDLDDPVPGYGDRTNVVFYNVEAARKYELGVYDSFIDNIDWVLLKKHKPVTPLIRDISKDNYEMVPVPFPKANQLPITLNHLVKAKPSKITVFGADLYLGGPGSAYDPKHLDRTAARDWWGIAFHEPIEQHAFMKELYRKNHGLIVGDKRFTDALCMSTQRYLMALRKAWNYGT